MGADLGSASAVRYAQQWGRFLWQMVSSPSLQKFKLLQDSRRCFLHNWGSWAKVTSGAGILTPGCLLHVSLE